MKGLSSSNTGKKTGSGLLFSGKKTGSGLLFLVVTIGLLLPLEIVQAQSVAGPAAVEQSGVGQSVVERPSDLSSGDLSSGDLYPGEEVTTASGKKMRIWSTESPGRTYPVPQEIPQQPQEPLPPAVTVVPVPIMPVEPGRGDYRDPRDTRDPRDSVWPHNSGRHHPRYKGQDAEWLTR
ncbi:MAG: hypothetical protein PHC51_06020 [bacterium]|nr:hypothetical protein [bacterium]